MASSLLRLTFPLLLLSGTLCWAQQPLAVGGQGGVCDRLVYLRCIDAVLQQLSTAGEEGDDFCNKFPQLAANACNNAASACGQDVQVEKEQIERIRQELCLGEKGMAATALCNQQQILLAYRQSSVCLLRTFLTALQTPASNTNSYFSRQQAVCVNIRMMSADCPQPLFACLEPAQRVTEEHAFKSGFSVGAGGVDLTQLGCGASAISAFSVAVVAAVALLVAVGR